MAGVKGKGGLKKGRTNNPNGRPKGVPNKIPETVKKKIVEFVGRDFDSYIEALLQLEPRDRVKAETELIKLVVPRPVSREELDALTQAGSPLVARLFMREKSTE
jgi:hypothetical protein